MDNVTIVDDKADIEEYVDLQSASILQDLHPGSIETVSSSSYGNKSSNLNDILIRDSNKFYKKHRPKFLEQAIIIPSVSNTVEMNNEESFKAIESHSVSQAENMKSFLAEHKFEAFKPKTLEEIEKENSRLARILDMKHLKMKNVTNKPNKFDEDNLESELDDDEDLKDALSDADDGKYEGISKTNGLLKKVGVLNY